MSERSRFAAFSEEVFGQEPFPWQADLAEMLVTGEMPDAIDVPTGLGKTRALAAWVYALGRQIQARGRRQLPIRSFFVVDRRIIVDAATQDALRLQEALANPRGPITHEVSEAMSSFTETPLDVTAMRGGLTWDAVWQLRPDQPAIVAGTVDQFGSRLLFRGYGTSKGLRPIDAALVGVDSWLLIDEAHIAGPLVGTARIASEYQSIGEASVGRELRVTAMSATVAETAENPLKADLDDQVESDEFPIAATVARRRIETSKPARLVAFGHQTGSRKAWRARVPKLGRDLAEVAIRFSADGGVTAVVCNTIAVARAVHSELAKNHDAILLIGRCREFEKHETLSKWLPQISAGSTDRAENLFVVATQTIEVGADLDFDALITEAAPMSSLVQRFGRVNRRGERPPATSAIVYMPIGHDEDPIYGEATRRTWEALTANTSVDEISTRSDISSLAADVVGDHLDFGIRRLAADSPGYVSLELEPEPPFTPVMSGVHIDQWAQTNPAPLQDTEIAPYLRGVERRHVDVSVLWRVPPPGIDTADDDRTTRLWSSWLKLQPPRAFEMIDVPLYAVLSFLGGGRPTPTADVEIVSDAGDLAQSDGADDSIAGIVWEGEDEVALLRIDGRVSIQGMDRSRRLRPGDIVVLDAGLGGHDQWGWIGSGTRPVRDVGDLLVSDNEVRWRPAVRWDPRILAPIVPESTSDPGNSSVFPLYDPEEQLVAETILRAAPWFEYHGDANPELQWVALITEESDELDFKDRSPVPLMKLGHNTTTDRATVSDDGSAESTSLTGRSVGLPSVTSHGATVGSYARLYAENLGFDRKIVHTLELAGQWHDVGKADPRFQAMLIGGDAVAAAALPDPIAKSGTDPRSSAARRARWLAGVPRGFRHEAVSVRLIEALVDAGPSDDVSQVDLDLLLHLIASHHGKSRPLLPPLVDTAAQAIQTTVGGMDLEIEPRMHQIDWEQPRRFSSLNERYGWWGLATLETILRLADMKASMEGK